MPQVIAATVMSGTHEFVPALIFRKVNLKKKYLQISLALLGKNSCGHFLGFFIMLSLPIHEHGRSVHLLISSFFSDL
jgi:hypothetical protein